MELSRICRGVLTSFVMLLYTEQDPETPVWPKGKDGEEEDEPLRIKLSMHCCLEWQSSAGPV